MIALANVETSGAANIRTPIELAALVLILAFGLFTKLAAQRRVEGQDPVLPERLARYAFILAILVILASLGESSGVGSAIWNYVHGVKKPILIGNVQDASDQAIGVISEVTIKSDQTGKKRTDDNGDYRFDALPSGMDLKSAEIWAVPDPQKSPAYGPSEKEQIDLKKVHSLNIPLMKLTKAKAPTLQAISPAGQGPAACETQNSRANPGQQNPLETTHFYFNYQFDPQPGKRVWTKVTSSCWKETYPDNEFTYFTVTDTAAVEGCDGTVVSRVPDQSFQVFIPDKNCTPYWTRFRENNGQWAWLGQILQ